MPCYRMTGSAGSASEEGKLVVMAVGKVVALVTAVAEELGVEEDETACRNRCNRDQSCIRSLQQLVHHRRRHHLLHARLLY